MPKAEPVFLQQAAVETLQQAPPVGVLHFLTDKGQFAFAITGEAARDVAAKLLAFANQPANDR